jgi:LysM repeat protein
VEAFMTKTPILTGSAVSLTLATALASSLAMGGSAAAHTQCGGSYRVSSGDTLYSIAQQCRVSLARIIDLNPGLDADAIPVGTRLVLSAGGAQDGRDTAAPERRNAEGRYEVREGDTAFSIAQGLGLTLQELMAANPDLDPLSMAIGEVLDLPNGDRTATVNLSTRSGPPGSQVTLSARGLRPNDWVTIGAGRASSEWRRIREVQVEPDGEVSATVEVPGWADSWDLLTFVVDTDRGVTYKSADFEVTPRRDERNADRVALEGRVAKGVECYTLTTPDGDLYSIVGDNISFTPGEYVEVEGTRAEMSFCQQGEATINVAEIREVPAPND